MEKTDFNVLELFCRASYVRASMHRITSFELLRTLNSVLVQKKQMKRLKHICWKASFSVRESCLCNFKSKAEYMKDVPFSWNEVLELQCTESLVWASKTLIAVLVQKSKWRELQAHICWKASFSVRESWFMQF